MGRVKRLIMGASAVILGLLGAISGLGSQSAAGPYIGFMLGYIDPKAAAAAAIHAFWVCIGAIIAYTVPGHGAIPWAIVVLYTAGATIGAVIAAPLAAPLAGVRRLLQGLAFPGLIYILALSAGRRFGGLEALPWEVLRSPGGWALAGAACGAMARVGALPIGVLVVPALVFGADLSPAVASVTALAIAALAALLPVLGYTASRIVDPPMGRTLNVGGALGGAAGGYALAAGANASSTWPLQSFCVVAMLLCAWLIQRSRMQN